MGSGGWRLVARHRPSGSIGSRALRSSGPGIPPSVWRRLDPLSGMPIDIGRAPGRECRRPRADDVPGVHGPRVSGPPEPASPAEAPRPVPPSRRRAPLGSNAPGVGSSARRSEAGATAAVTSSRASRRRCCDRGRALSPEVPRSGRDAGARPGSTTHRADGLRPRPGLARDARCSGRWRMNGRAMGRLLGAATALFLRGEAQAGRAAIAAWAASNRSSATLRDVPAAGKEAHGEPPRPDRGLRRRPGSDDLEGSAGLGGLGPVRGTVPARAAPWIDRAVCRDADDTGRTERRAGPTGLRRDARDDRPEITAIRDPNRGYDRADTGWAAPRLQRLDFLWLGEPGKRPRCPPSVAREIALEARCPPPGRPWPASIGIVPMDRRRRPRRAAEKGVGGRRARPPVRRGRRAGRELARGLRGARHRGGPSRGLRRAPRHHPLPARPPRARVSSSPARLGSAAGRSAPDRRRDGHRAFGDPARGTQPRPGARPRLDRTRAVAQS